MSSCLSSAVEISIRFATGTAMAVSPFYSLGLLGLIAKPATVKPTPTLKRPPDPKDMNSVPAAATTAFVPSRALLKVRGGESFEYEGSNIEYWKLLKAVIPALVNIVAARPPTAARMYLLAAL
jgi:hypothetical protein